MIFLEFGGPLAEILARSPLAKSRPLLWTIIANPRAGGFIIHSRWAKHREQLDLCAALVADKAMNSAAEPSVTALKEGDKNGLILTSGKGHAHTITQSLIEEAAASLTSAEQKPLYLIITAGGDGTSLEVLSALFHAPEAVRFSFVVLRLPMGTGNDGACARELDDALRLVIEPSRIIQRRAVRLSTATEGKGPFLAFNILSVGLDAFVTHMTNKMKGNLPGDFYKLWVDIAALLYDRLYKVGPLDVRALDESGNEVKTLNERILLMAVGESGHRTYGSNKRILPDSRNVCAVKQMSLFRKIALKGLFTTGEHIIKPESILFNASRVEFSGLYPILAQMDGETVLLQKDDFPAVIELTEPLIPVLQLDDNETN